MSLSQRLLTLRRSPILLKLPPYLSALCTVVGIAWLFILPLDEYSRQTYISENAILPGQVHTYFGGSEHNVFRAYRQEVWNLGQQPDEYRIQGLGRVMKEMGLKVAEQPYRYDVAGQSISGKNVYALLAGPKADATEAMVLIAAWRNSDNEVNYSGVALALTLARYFKRWSIWSKDILLLIPDDSFYGPDAWVAAYHSTAMETTSSRNISSLPIKGGALQGAVALDYPVGPWGKRFDKLDIQYDGINGALPNLDLLNTAISVASGQMGIGCSLHGRTDHGDSYQDRLGTLLKGVMTQGTGHATGPHSAFMPYHVDAITLKTVGDGWHDEMSLGRVTESLFRSINNLLEHFHQSFFFYVLLNAHRFVSIGNYLPAAMLIAGNFSITALALWVQSGQRVPASKELAQDKKPKKEEIEQVKVGKDIAILPKAQSVERQMFVPASILLGIHILAFAIFYLLNSLSASLLPLTLQAITAASLSLPYLLTTATHQTTQQLQILQSFSLLFFGAALSMLATLNFSLAFMIGILAAPLSFARPLPKHLTSPAVTAAISIPSLLIWAVLSPPVVLYGITFYWHLTVEWLLVEMAKGWVAQGVWTGIVIWGLWWPVWIVSGMVVFSGLVR